MSTESDRLELEAALREYLEEIEFEDRPDGQVLRFVTEHLERKYPGHRVESATISWDGDFVFKVKAKLVPAEIDISFRLDT